MALLSVDGDTRDFIVQQLDDRSSLQPEHRDIVLYNKQLTALYPCSSFTAAKGKQANGRYNPLSEVYVLTTVFLGAIKLC